MSSTQVGAPVVNAYLNNVTSSNATPTQLVVTGNDGALVVHVQSDSTLALINSQTVNGPYSNGKVVVVGTGHLTANFIGSEGGYNLTTHNLDASSSAGIDVLGIGGSGGVPNTVVLSAYNDSVAVDLLGASVSTFTLGAGSDVFKLYENGVSAPRFSNLSVANNKVTTFATLTDFEKGVDHVDLGTVIPAVTTGISAGSATTLEQALINASSQVSANGTGVFEWNGDTYIYHQDATVGVNTGDGLIRLVGVTGLTVGTGASSVDIHFG